MRVKKILSTRNRMNRDCFDLSDLSVGKVLEIKADIKADFSIYPPEDE